MKTKKYKDTTVMTPPGRLSYPALLKPRAFEGGEPKYSCMLIFPKGADLKEMKKKAKLAAKDFFKGKVSKNARSPFRDHESMCEDANDPSKYDGFEDCIFVRFSSQYPIGVVNEDAEDVIKEEEVYPGRWARCIARPAGYSNAGNKGITFYLSDVQLLDHDERLGDGGSRKGDFESVEIKSQTNDNNDGDEDEDDEDELW